MEGANTHRGVNIYTAFFPLSLPHFGVHGLSSSMVFYWEDNGYHQLHVSFFGEFGCALNVMCIERHHELLRIH